MSTSSRHPLPSGRAITLISGSSGALCSAVAGQMVGSPVSRQAHELDLPGADSAQLALELAESFIADADRGITGHAAVVLDADADVVEVALVLEHVLDSQQLQLPVGIRDVVAVTSVEEIRGELFGVREESVRADGWNSPGQLAARVEFASLIVLADVEGADLRAEVALVRSLIASIAPAARVLTLSELSSARSESGLLARRRAHRLGASMGWQRQLADHAPTRRASGPIDTVVFRDPRPFHPGRLHHAIAHHLTPDSVGRIVRSRGFTRLATRAGRVGSWSTAGDVLDLDPTTMLSWDSDSPIGQEIVFFGLGLDAAALEATLAHCLLGPEELTAGPAVWSSYPDPFPEWAVHDHH